MEKVKEFLKSKYLWIEGGLLICCIIIGIVVMAFNEKANNIKKDLTKKQNEYSQLQSKYSENQRNINEQDKKIKELEQEEKQREINSNIATLESKKGELEKEKQSLESQIKTLNKDVIRIKGEPKTYPAGHLTAGTDTPTGKYKIYGGSSNFAVYSSTGRLEVNIILGSRYGVDEYIYTFKTGDKIKASSSFKLVEVE